MARLHPLIAPLLGAALLAAGSPPAQQKGQNAQVQRHIAALRTDARKAARALIAADDAAIHPLIDVLQNGLDTERAGHERFTSPLSFHVHAQPKQPESLIPPSRWLNNDPLEGAAYVRGFADVNTGLDQRVLAAWCLGEIGDPRAIPALTVAATDVGLQIRLQAVSALGAIGPQAASGLGVALDHPLSGYLAARILADQGVAATATLRDALRAGEPTAHRHALLALAWMAPEGAIAVMPELMRDFDSGEGDVRAVAAWALARSGRAAVSPLMLALVDGDDELRRRAAGVLALLGPDSRPAAQLLVDQLQSEDEELRLSCALALGRIGVEGASAMRAVRELSVLLDHGTTELRLTALETLGQIGTKLGGPGHADAVRAVVDATKHEDAQMRRKAMAVLGNFRGDATVVLEPLSLLLADDDPDVQCNAATSLGRLGAAALPAVSALTDALESPHNKLRAYAARALGQIGPGAHDAAPSLQVAAHDPVRYVADHARVALAKVKSRD